MRSAATRRMGGGSSGGRRVMAYGGMTVDNQALMEKAEMCRNCKARRRDREKLLRCGKLIRRVLGEKRRAETNAMFWSREAGRE